MTRGSTYKKWFSRAQWWGLIIFIFFALAHQFIASEKYLLAATDNGVEFMYSGDANWGIKSPIPYSPSYIDKANRLTGPFDHQNVPSLYYRHWLGTDDIGRDVFAGLIYGSYIAFKVGLLSIVLSLFVGIILSYISGYYGDRGYRIEKMLVLPAILISIIAAFYIFYLSLYWSILLFVALIIFWTYLAGRKNAKTSRTIGIPLDLIVLRIIDIIDSMPGLFLILILLNLFSNPSILNVVFVIAFMRWPVVTRHLRAEILKIKEEDYIMAARSIGQKDYKIFLKHILPMAASPLVIVSSFGFAAAVLTESTLSFLGIGVPLDVVTWGSLIKQARFNFDAWWLAFFPGLAIYAVVILFNSIGDGLNKRLRGLSA